MINYVHTVARTDSYPYTTFVCNSCQLRNKSFDIISCNQRAFIPKQNPDAKLLKKRKETSVIVMVVRLSLYHDNVILQQKKAFSSMWKISERLSTDNIR